MKERFYTKLKKEEILNEPDVKIGFEESVQNLANLLVNGISIGIQNLNF